MYFSDLLCLMKPLPFFESGNFIITKIMCSSSYNNQYKLSRKGYVQKRCHGYVFNVISKIYKITLLGPCFTMFYKLNISTLKILNLLLY